MQVKKDSTPWYRQFWPWFIIFFPVLAIVAGIITLMIAIESPNPVVEDDYYKEGLAINRSLERVQIASDLQVNVILSYPADAKEIRLQLAGEVLPPEMISIVFSHPTLEQHDRRATLINNGDFSYSGPLDLPVEGNWDIEIEGADRSWLLKGRVRLPAGEAVTLGA